MKKLLLYISVIFFATINISNAQTCLKLHKNYMDPEVILNKGARDLGIEVIDARAVKSNDFKNFYFVQYKLKTPNNGIIFPMFAMNKPLSPKYGVIYSMDETAIAISGYGDGRQTKASFSVYDDGFYEATNCLK